MRVSVYNVQRFTMYKGSYRPSCDLILYTRVFEAWLVMFSKMLPYITVAHAFVRPAIDLSYFTFCGFFESSFRKTYHEVRNTRYTLCISFNFCISSMPQKKTIKPFEVLRKYQPWREMRNIPLYASYTLCANHRKKGNGKIG